MADIDVIVPDRQLRRWQADTVARLVEAGHRARMLRVPAPAPWPALADAVLSGEHRLLRAREAGLWTVVPAGTDHPPRGRPDLTLDLSGGAAVGADLALRFDGSPSPGAALRTLAAGGLPELVAVRADGTVAGTALPMVDTRVLLSRALDDVLARAVTLSVAAAERVLRGDSVETVVAAAPAPPADGFAGAWLGSALPRLAGEVWRRARFRHAHWRVGYRFTDGAGAADARRLGNGWIALPDDGSRFYADPFVFAHEGVTALFVEDYPHATGKAVISAATLEDDRFGGPRPVLEEPFHLSYPQVFARGGQVWMIPESVGARAVLLYRAERFPDRWVRHATLIPDRELSDATLLDHDGRLWLFATDRDGLGSTSDTLVVYSAERLEGPWQPHPMNPIRIDRRGARPGGAFVRAGDRLLLPVQDGTLGYGGGLGFSELLQLDAETVRLGPPVPLDPAGDWPHRQVHTYNRAGGIEVIDGLMPMRRHQASSAS